MASNKAATRRRYIQEFKAQVITECDARSASVAKVVMSHGIDTNIVHGWRKLAREGGAVTTASPREFVPIALKPPHVPPAVERCIEVELCRGAVTMKVTWPVSATADFATWTREDCGGPRRCRVACSHATGHGRRHGVGPSASRQSLRCRPGPYLTYLFANWRANRMKVLVHDGIGVWLPARRLNQDRFVWPLETDAGGAATPTLKRAYRPAHELSTSAARTSASRL
jgi:transposase